MTDRIARFTVKSANGEVQDVGYRIFILTSLKGYGLDCSMPLNVPGGGVKVVVRGDEQTIKDAIDELRKDKPDIKKVGKISVSDPDYNVPASEYKPLTNDDIQFLTLNQLSKGIPAIIGMRDHMENALTPKIESINEVVGGLDGKYHTISRNLNYVVIGVGLIVVIAVVYGFLLFVR
ncbi:MAG: acylphosphatase [Candidatus Altiarchaeia archaeon]